MPSFVKLIPRLIHFPWHGLSLIDSYCSLLLSPSSENYWSALKLFWLLNQNLPISHCCHHLTSLLLPRSVWVFILVEWGHCHSGKPHISSRAIWRTKGKVTLGKAGRIPGVLSTILSSGIGEEYAELLYGARNLKDQLVHISQFIYKNKWPKNVTGLS